MIALSQRTNLLNTITFVMLISLLGMVFFYAPTELTMGNVQRILYFHVGTAWVACLTFFIALIEGIRYLRNRNPIDDIISMASVEIGLVFFTMTIAAGAIWGKPIWNKWWVWTPRLTTVTIMWLVYVGYFMLRGAVDSPQRRARFAAIYVIAAFATVIVTYTSVRFLRDIHPVVVGGVTETVAEASMSEGESEFANGIESRRMGFTLAYACVVFMVLYITWLANRFRLQLLLNQTNQLKAKIIALRRT